MSNQNGSPPHEGLNGASAPMKGPVDLMFDQFCREANIDTDDQHTVENLRLVWMAAFMNCYNYTMEAMRRDMSLQVFAKMSEAFRLNLDTYFAEREARKVVAAAAANDQH